MIPTYDRFIEPVLRYLADHSDGAPAREVYEAAADALGVSAEERLLMLPSGRQAVYHNRVGWAHDRLKRAGFSSSHRTGFWQLTELGSQFARAHADTLSAVVVAQIAGANKDTRIRPAKTPVLVEVANSIEQLTATPDDRLEAAIAELHSAVAAELLETLAHVQPMFFETIVLDLLHRMGYGTTRDALQQVGGPYDGGIDGIISLDRLGLEKVYVQAKRWQNVVGSQEVQAFYGALAQQNAKKGVFITTSSFSRAALDFVRSVDGIVVIDGARLTELLIDHEVGVSIRAIKIPKLDRDYFQE